MLINHMAARAQMAERRAQYEAEAAVYRLRNEARRARQDHLGLRSRYRRAVFRLRLRHA